MLTKLAQKIFGSRNDRMIKRYQKVVLQINALESEMQALSDEDLQAKTSQFRLRIENGETLDAILPEAFAVIREASSRVLGMRHHDVQLIGGMILNDGNISEMKTGEGKTLVATLSVYLNALSGKGVHVVTVNDYLAQRDSAEMSELYSFLGLTTGVVISGQDPEQKMQAYQCDITYGTNNEFGFDYLRDNMAFDASHRVQRGHAYAVVDEVDSILIDEARTPLVISGPTEDKSEVYALVNQVVPKLERQLGEIDKEGNASEDYVEGDFTVEEKEKQVLLTERGHSKVEEILAEMGLIQGDGNLYDAQNITLMHHVLAALKAHHLFEVNVDYIIENGEVVIIDEFTGRKMQGRRWSDGLHQAVEAKEGVNIQNENQTLASITFQNYFRLYEKLSGMTGTADTEAAEFNQIYSLEVLVVPTHRPVQRKDHADVVYMSQLEKFKAIVEDIRERQEHGQPVLVGTASIEASELLSSMLSQNKIKHEVLNAKQHEREAHIIAQAGQKGAVTIATNMAGRGTDIKLGGNVEFEIQEQAASGKQVDESALREEWQKRHDEVLELGGLYVIGTERNESRRVDNQLRGRSGRQGDPGASRFYLSLEDGLMRMFASDRIKNMMQKLGMKEGEAIEHPWVTRAIENAQRKVEGRNFDIRKQLLEYDDVANDQRKVVYQQRDELMASDNVAEYIDSMREEVVTDLVSTYVPPGSIEEMWDIKGLEMALLAEFAIELPIQKWLDEDDELYADILPEKVLKALVDAYAEKEAQLETPEIMRHFEKSVILQTLDSLWKEHLAAMDHLRQGIHLRGYAQKNPVQEYKREAFEMFGDFLSNLRREVVRIISQVQVRSEEDARAVEEQRRAAEEVEMEFTGSESSESAQEEKQAPMRTERKVGRNDPCPCGSGKKYKQCCGKLK